MEILKEFMDFAVNSGWCVDGESTQNGFLFYNAQTNDRWIGWQAAQTQVAPEGFEQAYSEIFSPIVKRPYPRLENGDYKYIEIDQGWKLWQAATAQAVPEGFVLIEASELESLKSDNEHFTKSCIDWTERAYKQRAKVDHIKNEVERFKQSGTSLDLGSFLDNLIEFSTFKHNAEFDGFVLVPEWISVKDKLPGFNQSVLCCDGFETCVAEYLESCKNDYGVFFEEGFWINGAASIFENVTHWMPLPKVIEAQEQSHD